MPNDPEEFYEDEEEEEDEVEEDEEDRPWPVTKRTLKEIDSMSPDELEALESNIHDLECWEYDRERLRTRTLQWLGALKKADEAPRCEFIRLNGSPCGSPAVSGQTLCYFHGEASAKRVPEDANAIVDLSTLEDRASVQLAILRVCNQLIAKGIDEKTGRALVAALRLAEQNLKNRTSVL